MSKGYGQFCPLAKAAELLCERWTMIVVRELTAGSRRFNELRRGLPLMSPTLLSRRLKQLVSAGVIDHRMEPDGTLLYELTRAGKELQPLIEMLGTWGHRWVGSQLQDDDLDVGLLMWDIRRGVNREVFPTSRIVIEFQFHDAPAGMGQWWLVSTHQDVDLCLEDPGYEVDVLVRSSVRTLTEVWMSHNTFSDALKAGDLRLAGAEKLKQQLPVWLQGSPLARLGALSLVSDPIQA